MIKINSYSMFLAIILLFSMVRCDESEILYYQVYKLKNNTNSEFVIDVWNNGKKSIIDTISISCSWTTCARGKYYNNPQLDEELSKYFNENVIDFARLGDSLQISNNCKKVKFFRKDNIGPYSINNYESKERFNTELYFIINDELLINHSICN